MAVAGLGWFGIVRLGLVQTALGAIVVLATSTMNRVMVVELGLPAILPGLLVAWHYGVQALRPRLGYGSDVGGRRTAFIVGGMVVLAIGAIGAAAATALMTVSVAAGAVLAFVGFTMIGLGVGACGTSLLVLLAKQVAPPRRAAAASIVWIMMIAGFVLTATIAGRALDPFSPLRLIEVTAAIACAATLVTLLAVWRIEDDTVVAPSPSGTSGSFRQALAQVWAEPQARRFAIFVFFAMLAYGSQELVLEPFGGTVFAMTPAQSAQLAGMQHAGVLLGMLLVGFASNLIGGRILGSMRVWTTGGCIASAAAIASLAFAGVFGIAWAIRPLVLIAGAANGAFSIAAIGSMMGLADAGRQGRAGLRMGLWGAAQALAFSAGGVIGTSGSDVARAIAPDASVAYAAVFVTEALLFLFAALQAARAFGADPERRAGRSVAAPLGVGIVAGMRRG